MTGKLTRGFLALALPIALAATWWLASAGSTNPYYPPLSEIVRNFGDVWTSDQLRTHLLPSLASLILGLALAAVFGVAGGIAMGYSERLRRDVRPTIEFLRATPVVALIPIALVLLGPGTQMEVTMIAFAATWPIVVATTDGVRAADEVMLDTVRVFGITARGRLLRVALPSALPQVMGGVRIAVAVAVATMLVTNMVGSSAGLGYFVISAQQSFNLKETWAGLLLIGIVGCGTTFVVAVAERLVLRWHRLWRAKEVET
ncbi:ABC transporter permease [Rhodococcus rhodochrous]|uniref:ABC transporter permease n=1 Tax=Rhodococcus rhodochrous TaxID=1829 RepID=A0AAW4XPS7_RHORH|nr:ABC transporter permease [Rhodococcus rhodochrous]MCD2114866.1 ABC transporter permease [Rhodococcus rhodochrous]TWH44228.1 ABC-type nitrate/sulfonate/bicarbonate transport system permease component [Rhodococcus rhodochrous J38]